MPISGLPPNCGSRALNHRQDFEAGAIKTNVIVKERN